jgi:hypothetical protein
MTTKRWFQVACVFTAAAALTVATSVVTAHQAKAEDDDHDRGERHDSRVRIGFAIAPVPLNLKGKNEELVGLGSYLVNAVGECDGCHSAGPQTQYAPGGNPFFGQPEHLNPATYLGGGRSFGSLIPGTPEIISRNLTPDATGRPIGGDSFEHFLHTIRTGIDPDQLHPPCTGAPDGSCLPLPFHGELLQVMPWPTYRHMTTHELRAIYEYLGAIPCVQGNYPGEDPHRCG